jgi:hypothetical protein
VGNRITLFHSCIYTVVFDVIEKSKPLQLNFNLGMILTVSFVLGFILWFVSFYKIYWKTKWWQYGHQTTQKYDEREWIYVNDAVKKSYTIFTIIVLYQL